MIKILGMIPNPNDVTSYYRAVGPFATIEKQYAEIQFTVGDDKGSYYDWHNLRRADIFFAQRPTLPVHAQAIMKAKEEGVPVWVDMDDDLLGVPRDNPAHAVYSQEQNQNALRHCLTMADLVTVPTRELQAVLSEFAKDVRVVPNAFDDAALGYGPDRSKPREKLVFWRGSPTHQRDLIDARDEIVAAAHAKPDWKWAFAGMDPAFITDLMPRGTCRVYPPMTISRYMHTIANLNHAIQIVPLTESRFNKCKSNIAWIEGTYAGAHTIARHWPEWKRPGVTHYDAKGSLKDALVRLMDDPETLKADRVGWEYIRSNLNLTDVNKSRMMLARELALK
jgi:hypothetical protein